MITVEELQETMDNLDVKPMHGNLLVVLPAISDTTDSGIIKGESNIEDEKGKMEAFVAVVAVASDVEHIKPLDRVYSQGTITVFDKETIPDELDIAPFGYTIGLLPAPYVKMINPYKGE